MEVTANKITVDRNAAPLLSSEFAESIDLIHSYSVASYSEEGNDYQGSVYCKSSETTEEDFSYVSYNLQINSKENRSVKTSDIWLTETELDKVIAMLQYANQHARDCVRYAAKNVA